MGFSFFVFISKNPLKILTFSKKHLKFTKQIY